MYIRQAVVLHSSYRLAAFGIPAGGNQIEITLMTPALAFRLDGYGSPNIRNMNYRLAHYIATSRIPYSNQNPNPYPNPKPCRNPNTNLYPNQKFWRNIVLPQYSAVELSVCLFQEKRFV